MWKILIFFSIVSSVSGLKYVHISGNITWNDFLTKAKYASREFIEKLEPYVLEHYPFEKVSEKCTRSLIRYVNGLKDWESWAVRMADANGKFPSGFITGTKIDLGSYNECLNLRVASNNESETFGGQFCMMSLRSPLLTCREKLTLDGRSYDDAYGQPPEWIKVEMEKMGCFFDFYGLYLGICTPSSCSQQDLYYILEAIGKPMELDVSLDDCHTDEPRKWPTYVKITVGFLLCWLGVILVGTALDIYEKCYSNSPIELPLESVSKKVLKAFSLYTNTEKCLDTRQSDGPLAFLFGVRCICCLWILSSHIFFYPDFWKFRRCNNFNHFMDLQSFPTLILENATLCIDIFLIISGFLMTYESRKKIEKSTTHKSILKSFLKIYFRYNVPVIFLILFSFALPYMYNGPIWYTTTGIEAERCYNNGWSNLIFLQNLFGISEMCWTNSWYLAGAVQIKIIATLVLKLTRRHFKTGIAFGALITIALFMIAVLVVYDGKYNTSGLFKAKSPIYVMNLIDLIHIKPYIHYQAFTIGMIVGYITKNNKGPISKEFQVFGWISFVIVCFLALYGLRLEIPNIYLLLFINWLKLFSWSISWGWFLFACTTTKGVLTNILSWKPFVVLGKLSFSVYVYHLLLLTAYYGSLRERVFFGNVSVLIDSTVLSTWSFLFAYFTYVAIEVPCHTLFNIWEGNDSPTFKEASSTTSKEINGKKIEGSDINKKEL